MLHDFIVKPVLDVGAGCFYSWIMSHGENPKLAKWPFFAADLLLLVCAYFVVSRGPETLDLWRSIVIVAAVGLGGYVSVLPFLKEYESSTKLAEVGELEGVVGQIDKVETIAAQITGATSRWQSVQEASERIVKQSTEISNRMTAEARAFSDFMKSTNDVEKTNLRLEVEKLRRVEGDWLQVLVHVQDHVFALHQSGVRSGQPALIENLTSFQGACHDASRRVGLGVFAAAPGEVFDPKRHQLVEGDASASAGRAIAGTLAPGYTFQGRLLRPVVVQLQADGAGATPPVEDPVETV